MYIGLMFAIAVLGITLATVGIVWSTQIRREKETELLWVGEQYRMAIGLYLGAGGQYPQDLSELLEDKRFPVARRYLRKLFPDPMTGKADWQLIPAPGSGIQGVASSSQGKPIKVAGFAVRDAAFKDAICYCDWKFVSSGRRLRGVRQVVPAESN
jgi:type II secretory pathway pseudopilin PulG